MSNSNSDLFHWRLGSLFGIPTDEEPLFISHYCDLTALLSILSKHSLWASNIRFLNDKEEMEFGIGIAKEVIAEMEQISGQDLGDPPVSFDPSVLPDVYAVSFCEKPDILSMWRGYGTGRQSVSIQFHRMRLSYLATMKDFTLQKVRYGREDAVFALRKDIKETREIVAAITRGTGSAFDPGMIVSRMAPQFKNEHFSEEQEWRMVSVRPPNEIKYRVRDNVLLPFSEVGMPDQPLPIRSITIGPGKEHDLTLRSVEHFLVHSEHYKNVEVIPSIIPYRT